MDLEAPPIGHQDVEPPDPQLPHTSAQQPHPFPRLSRGVRNKVGNSRPHQDLRGSGAKQTPPPGTPPLCCRLGGSAQLLPLPLHS